MANTITKRTLVDGSRICVLNFILHSDGSGEFFNETLVDFSSLLDNGDKTNVKVVAIKSQCCEFEIELLWKGSPDRPFLFLNSAPFDYDYRQVGGLINDAIDTNGDILFHSVGAAAGDDAHITMILEKRM